MRQPVTELREATRHSVVVSKLGTATLDEVMREFRVQDAERDDAPSGPLSIDLAAMVRRWKAQGLVVGFTNGCFYILHAGHVALLARARAACNRPIVALNTDASVSWLKGPARPVNDLTARALVIQEVRYVDCVTSFDTVTPLGLIESLLPACS